MASAPDPAAVLEQLMASAKYGDLDEEFVRRIAGEASDRFRGQGDAVKYAKRKLHQAFGAFVTGSLGDAVRACASAIRSGAPVRTACLTSMRRHASTAERVGVLEEFYRQIETWCGRPSAVADLACGLSPLAIPWLATGPDATYWCCDIDRDLSAELPRLSEPFGVALAAESRDLIRPASLPPADLVLLLKTLNTLEQQRTGAARDVLAALDAPQAVVSLARGSLSYRRRYSDDPLEVIGKAIAGSRYQLASRADLGSEALLLLERSGP